jgi:dephospho-CoA kinase
MDSLDPNAQNIGKCIELADYHLQNNGTIEQLNKQVEKILKEILQRPKI